MSVQPTAGPAGAVDRVVVPRTPPVVLALCFGFLTLEGYDLLMYGTVVPALLAYEPWGLAPSDVGHLGSLTVLGMLVGAFVAAAVTDRVGRRVVLLASVALFSLAMAACALAPDPTWFGAARLGVGVGAGGLMPTVVALLVEYSPVHRRGVVTAIAFSGVGVGGVVAGLLALWLVPTFGFRAMFVVGALPALVVLPLAWRLLPESVAFLLARGRRAEAREVARRTGVVVEGGDAPVAVDGPAPAGGQAVVQELLGRHLVATLLFWAATFLCLLVLFGTNTWLPTLMMGSGYGVTSSLVFLVVLNVGAVVGTLVASPVADRLGSRPVVAGAFLAAAGSLALLALHPPTALVLPLVAVAGLGSTGTQILLNTFVGSYYPTPVRATGLGLSLGVGRLGGVLGPTYGAAVVTGLSGPSQFHAFAVPAVLGALVTLAVPRAGRRGR